MTDAVPAQTPTDGRTTSARRKRAIRREKILEAALRVFSDKGYHQTRVSDIIHEASIARGTFYLYFDSKSTIFHELVDLLLERIEANIVGVDLRDGAAPMRDQVLVSVRRVLAAFRADKSLARLTLREAVGVDDETDRKLDEFYRQLHSWLQTSLNNGQALGLLRDIDSEYVAWSILGSVKQLLWLVIDEPNADLDRLGAVLLDHHLCGIRANV